MTSRMARSRPFRRSTVLALVITSGIAIGSLAGCDTPEPRTALSYSANAKRAYDEAMEEFRAHNWLEAQSLLREVKRKYSYSKYAKLSELRLADADFEQEKFAEAIRGYRQFVHDHRSDVDEVTYARARIAEAQYREISESILLPSADERDQAVILDAYRELKSFLHDYPSTKESDRVRELLKDVTARLVRHELYVARFYLHRDNFVAAVGRIQYALRNFGIPPESKSSKTRGAHAVIAGSGLEAEALLLLGEVYLKMRKYPEARDAFRSIVRDYPESPLGAQANNYLAYMRERGV